MGYTHYWRSGNAPVPSEAFGRLSVDARTVIHACEERGIKFGDWSGDKPFTDDLFTEGQFGFNGLGDESYEAFVWNAVPEAFDFCKTRGDLPYDIAVVAVLIRAQHHYGESVSVSSDGDWESDWADGATLCRELFGEAEKPEAV